MSIEVHPFRDAFLPYVGGEVKEVFDDLGRRVEPQLVFTHTREDLHQDHRLACELTWNTFRDCLIFEYEVPKFDGDFGRPNVYVPLRTAVAEEKIELLHRHFPTRSSKHWFDADTFRGLMRLRGMEANAARAASPRLDPAACARSRSWWTSWKSRVAIAVDTTSVGVIGSSHAGSSFADASCDASRPAGSARRR